MRRGHAFRRHTGAAGGSAAAMPALVLVCLLAVRAGAADVAVVATDPQLEPLSALVEVQLSQAGMELVERAALDGVLQEQEISAQGLTDRDALVRVGQLIGCDAFLLLSLEGPSAEGPGLLRVRLTETAHGVRLLDWFGAHSPADLEGAARQTAALAAGAAGKLSAADGSFAGGRLVPIGILDVRRVQLGEQDQWLCRVLVAMLSGRLSSEPDLLVLEREDLSLLRDEKTLGTADEGSFLRSGVLVDGYVRRVGRDGVELRLDLRRAAGGEMGSVTAAVDRSDLQAAVDNVARQLVDKLGEHRAPARWEPAAEAAEFYRQGLLLQTHAGPEAALPLLETAAALVPEDITYAGALFAHVLNPHYSRRRLYTDTELVDLASRLAVLLRQQVTDEQPYWEHFHKLDQYLMAPFSVADDRIRDINRANRKILNELEERIRQRTETQFPQSLGTLEISLALRPASTPQERIANIKLAVGRTIAVHGPTGEKRSANRVYGNCDALLQMVARCDMGPPMGGPTAEGENFFYRELLAYSQRLADAEEPVARFFANLMVVNIAHRFREVLPEAEAVDRRAHMQRALTVFRQDLEFSDAFPPATRLKMRGQLTGSLGSCMPPGSEDWMVATLAGFLEPLLDRKDVDDLILWRPGMDNVWHRFAPYADPDRIEAAGRYVGLLKGALALYDRKSNDVQMQSAILSGQRAADMIEDGYRQTLGFVQRQAEAFRRDGRTEDEKLARSYVRRIQEAFPALAGPTGSPGTAVRVLVRAADWPAPWRFKTADEIYSRVLVTDGVLWIALVDNNRPITVGLVGIDVATLRPVAFHQAVFQTGKRASLHWLRGLVVRPRHSYVAISTVGIVELPGSTATGARFIEDPRVLTERDGLPPGPVTAIADAGDRLWVGFGGHKRESGLGLYDPASGAWELQFSSALKGGGPLQSGKTYTVQDLVPVPGGVVFSSASGSGKSRVEGLWLMPSGGGGPELVYPASLFTGRLKGPDEGATVAARLQLAQVDFHRRSVRRLLVTAGERRRKRGTPRWQTTDSPFLPVDAMASLSVGTYEFGQFDLTTAAVHGDTIWGRHGTSRLAVLRRGSGNVQFMQNSILDGGKVLEFFSTPIGLLAVGQGTVGLVEGGP